VNVEAPFDWEFRPAGGEWAPIDVPAPWQKSRPGFHGAGVYRTALARTDRGPFLLRFEAVATEARVLVNGREAGSHLGAWTPFVVDLTPHLFDDLSQPNEVLVEVDEKPGHALAGFLPEIGAAFGGIWGDVQRVSEPLRDDPPTAPDPGIRVEGSRIMLRGRPLHLRGMLHWGYYPEHGAPAPARAEIEAEVAWLKSMGFNMVKFCLFIPPEEYLRVCDAEGIWVWQEYPLWNHPLDDPALLAEYEEFLRKDCGHPSVVIRTLTCENDRVDPGLARRFSSLVKKYAPHGLFLDNSSWLSLERVGDFHDEHPYLHNEEWPHYCERMKRAFRAKPEKPFLLGETMAADTLDLSASLDVDGDPGVKERSVRIAGSVRKYQAEKLRRELPHAGYVMNAMRDIEGTPLGFHTKEGKPKFRPEEWAWHRETMLLCDLDRFSFRAGSRARVALRASHYGPEPIEEEAVSLFNGKEDRFRFRLEPGETGVIGDLELEIPPAAESRAFPLRIRAGAFENRWNIWSVPEAETSSLPVVESLDPEILRRIEEGADTVLCAGPRKGSWRCPTFTWWSPAAWFREGLFSRGREASGRSAVLCPEELVEELLVFDLLSGRVLEPAQGLRPIVEVWDTHTEKGRNIRRPLVAETRIGQGRLLVTALRHDTPAGLFLLKSLAGYLSLSDPPELASPLSFDSVHLGGWKVSPKDSLGAPLPVRAGERYIHEGWARFETRFDLPGEWRGGEIILCCEAVADAFRIFIDKEKIGEAGNPERTWDGTRDKAQRFRLGLEEGGHTICIEARDWRGGGIMAGPVFLTRNPGSLIY